MEYRTRFRAAISGSRQSGMGMIEVLVALLVLAIGLFGVLSMETKGLQLNQAGYYQSQAMFLAQDILERMRANSSAAGSYYIDFGTTPGTPSPDCETDTATCKPTEMAASDLYYWKVKGLQYLLPSGDGKVDVTGPTNGLYQVDIQVKYVVSKLNSGSSTYAYYNLSAKL